MKREHLYKLRDLIRKAAESLTDEDALDGVEMFAPWMSGVTYSVGTRVRFGDKLYKAVQAHTSQDEWTPDATPALWTEVALPGEIPVWKQPTGAQDVYNTGDKVYYPDKNGDIWESTVDNNSWAPGVYGWKLV